MPEAPRCIGARRYDGVGEADRAALPRPTCSTIASSPHGAVRITVSPCSRASALHDRRGRRDETLAQARLGGAAERDDARAERHRAAAVLLDEAVAAELGEQPVGGARSASRLARRARRRCGPGSARSRSSRPRSSGPSAIYGASGTGRRMRRRSAMRARTRTRPTIRSPAARARRGSGARRSPPRRGAPARRRRSGARARRCRRSTRSRRSASRSRSRTNS